MGKVLTAATYRKAETQEELLGRFARLMRQRYGATLYLFGSRARGTGRPDSDFDIAAVSKEFQRYHRTERAVEGWSLWLEAGGWGKGLDLHCLTPEEFREETRYGWGYLGGSKGRGELIRIKVASPRRP
ncbi:MAG: nucleotidyltransferase domain-containing protein [Chloroflexi bacterium]|nr:nucleotidyltransferase domain-containing protein [Chloroflexota bacterium]